MISAARWKELEPLLDEALDLAPEARDAFLATTSSTDPELHAVLHALLRQAEQAMAVSLLDGSASGTFASLLRDDPAAIESILRRVLAQRYSIVRQIGTGGMATVYLAYDIHHDRQVAIKVLRPDLSSTIGAERFARELRLMAAIDHPHIVGVLDSGDAEGSLWMAMPFINGESLRQRMAREAQLPLTEALSIARQSATALAFAHARGVIHRDIKPDNILLSDGQAFIADFGIARAMQASEKAITATGMTIGTPAYMAPEQAAADKQLDGRVDVYALGAVLYEMLGGSPAFTGPTPQAILMRSMRSSPRAIHPIRRDVSPALDAVMLKAMARSPNDRYESMSAFGAAISAFV